MAISSLDVNRVLRAVVWPALRAEGFSERTARTAWRERREQVDIVCFWSHNAYNAEVLDVTTFSFEVALGTHPWCRTTDHTARRKGLVRPKEYQCDFRRTLRPTSPRPGRDRRSIWFVEPDGSNVEHEVNDARDVIFDTGLAWLSRLEGLDALLAEANTAPEDMDNTWGMGNLGSPHRIGLVADLEAAVSKRNGSPDAGGAEVECVQGCGNDTLTLIGLLLGHRRCSERPPRRRLTATQQRNPGAGVTTPTTWKTARS